MSSIPRDSYTKKVNSNSSLDSTDTVETQKQSTLWEFGKYRQLLKEKGLPCHQMGEKAAAARASLEQEEGETASKLELRHKKVL